MIDKYITINEYITQKCREFLLTRDDLRKEEAYGTSRAETEEVLTDFLAFLGAPPLAYPTPLELAREKLTEAYKAWGESREALEALEAAPS
jgi:hypothetical protein